MIIFLSWLLCKKKQNTFYEIIDQIRNCNATISNTIYNLKDGLFERKYRFFLTYHKQNSEL